MDIPDPSPFGYTFSTDYLDVPPATHDSQGQGLLSEMETQGLDDFFTHGPLVEPSAYPPQAGSVPALGALEWSIFGPPPPTIHRVSTTIPNQTSLPEYPSYDPNLVSPHTAHFPSTADDFQAASTLFNNAHNNAFSSARNSLDNGAQMGPPASRPHGYHATPATSGGPNVEVPNVFNGAMFPTSSGMIPEQLSALLPRHHAPGSVDAAIADQWSNQSVQQQHAAQAREILPPAPDLKRTFSYGTDTAFGESGFQVSNEQETESYVVGRLLNDMHHAQTHPALANGDAKMGGDDEHDEDEDEDEDEDTEDRSSKRRKSGAATAMSPTTANGSRRAGAGKNRKASTDDRVSKRKRGSVTAHRPPHKNLTEEQKRSNHINSEQKRRDLIAAGFKDLADLVPELRTGGLSKSAVLNEAANYLERLVADNERYEELMASAVG